MFIQLHRDLEAGPLKVLVEAGQEGLQRPAQIHWLEVEGILASLDAGEVIEGGDQVLEHPGPVGHDLQVVPPLLRGEPLGFQKLEIAQNGGEGGAQVMGDVGDLPAEALLLLSQCPGLLLPVLQQAVDLGQQLLHRAVRGGQAEALAGLGAGLPKLPGRPVQGGPAAGPEKQAQGQRGEQQQDRHSQDLLRK